MATVASSRAWSDRSSRARRPRARRGRIARASHARRSRPVDNRSSSRTRVDDHSVSARETTRSSRGSERVDREDAFDARGVGSRGVRAFTRRDRGDDRVHHDRFDSIRFDSPACNGRRLSRSRSNARARARATTTRVSRLYLYELPHGVTQSGHEDLLEVRNHVYRHAA